MWCIHVTKPTHCWSDGVMLLKPKTCAQRLYLILIRVPRGIIFTRSGRCISSDLTLAEGRCVLSALSPGSALAPPSHPSFRLGGTADGGERDNWPGFKIYCSRVWTHEPGVNRQAQSSQSSQYCGHKNSCPLIPRPRIQILATKLCVVLVKNTNWSIDLSRVSVPLPHSGWRVFYLFHEFPFILSRTEPSRAELTDPDLGSST